MSVGQKRLFRERIAILKDQKMKAREGKAKSDFGKGATEEAEMTLETVGSSITISHFLQGVTFASL